MTLLILGTLDGLLTLMMVMMLGRHGRDLCSMDDLVEIDPSVANEATVCVMVPTAGEKIKNVKHVSFVSFELTFPLELGLIRVPSASVIAPAWVILPCPRDGRNGAANQSNQL